MLLETCLFLHRYFTSVPHSSASFPLTPSNHLQSLLESLDEHQDTAAQRKVAFTLHFTQNWKRSYGGLLTLLTEDRNNIRHSFVPTYNTLTIMDVSRDRRDISPWHMVTAVAEGVKDTRVALTGWFQYQDSPEAIEPQYEWLDWRQ